MNVRMAEAEVLWKLNEAEGECCGLKASAWNHAEEASGGSGGGRPGGGLPTDRYPDFKAPAVSRLRRADHAFKCLTLKEQLTLIRRYKDRGPNVPTVPGFDVWSVVGEHLPQVQKKLKEQRYASAHEALREMAKKAKDATLLEQCKALVNVALDRFGAELDAFDAESTATKLANRDRQQAVRDGREA